MPTPKLTASRMALHGIHAAYQDLELKDYPGDEEAHAYVVKYIEEMDANVEAGRGLYMFGPNGTGKTALGMEILKAALRKDYTAQCTSWPLVIDARTQAWGDRNASIEFRYRILTPTFLQLDDIGKEAGAGKELSISVLDLILRRRSMKKLPTIITSNAQPEEIREVYGSSIASLLNGTMVPLEVPGLDLRDWEPE